MSVALEQPAPTIRDLTHDLHEELESLPANQKLFRGEQTDFDRKVYLASWEKIFKFLDQYVPEGLRRAEACREAIAGLGGYREPPTCGSIAYVHYLRWVKDNDLLNGHIYLNYMGMLFGGQIMKKKYPTSAQVYEFDDVVYWRQYIRDNYVDMSEQFIHEVKQGFKMHISIGDELGRLWSCGKSLSN